MRRKEAITNLAASVAHDPMTLQPVLIMRSIHPVESMMHRVWGLGLDEPNNWAAGRTASPFRL